MFKQNALAFSIVAQSPQSMKLSHLQNYSSAKTILPQKCSSTETFLYDNIKAICSVTKTEVPGFFKIPPEIIWEFR